MCFGKLKVYKVIWKQLSEFCVCLYWGFMLFEDNVQGKDIAIKEDTRVREKN